MASISFSARVIANASAASTQCAVIPIFKNKKLGGEAAAIDKALSGGIQQVLTLGDFSGAIGQTMMLPGAGKMQRVLLIGCGDGKTLEREQAREVSTALAKRLVAAKASDAILHLGLFQLSDADTLWTLDHFARQTILASYRYTATLSKPKAATALKRVTVNIADSVKSAPAKRALAQGAATGKGMNEARELADLPGNICTPNYLAKQSRKLARSSSKLSVSILEEKKMRELGMGSLLSVSAGSVQPAKFIIMQYKGGKASAAPHVLVGKGITFDSGGISLKPGAKMDEMKYDMGGAASVIGTMNAITELEIPLNVIGVIAAAENMPSGIATKPGDVVTSMSGKTIEVLNTDAEGRLVLCDALTYVARYKPASVIDIATLTGACIVALGSHASALYANDDALAEQLLNAGSHTHDRAWRMPLWDDYQKQLKSNFADVANIGGPAAGSVTAACFLSRFAQDYNWAHLDIAGSAWNSAPKGATGRPVALLTRYLLDRAGV
ncbi:MAG: leucyl aminopeptidase [Halioglobus sp.]